MKVIETDFFNCMIPESCWDNVEWRTKVSIELLKTDYDEQFADKEEQKKVIQRVLNKRSLVDEVAIQATANLSRRTLVRYNTQTKLPMVFTPIDPDPALSPIYVEYTELGLSQTYYRLEKKAPSLFT